MTEVFCNINAFGKTCLHRDEYGKCDRKIISLDEFGICDRYTMETDESEGNEMADSQRGENK